MVHVRRVSAAVTALSGEECSEAVGCLGVLITAYTDMVTNLRYTREGAEL